MKDYQKSLIQKGNLIKPEKGASIFYIQHFDDPSSQNNSKQIKEDKQFKVTHNEKPKMRKMLSSSP
jgi:hypothetical protein